MDLGKESVTFVSRQLKGHKYSQNSLILRFSVEYTCTIIFYSPVANEFL